MLINIQSYKYIFIHYYKKYDNFTNYVSKWAFFEQGKKS